MKIGYGRISTADQSHDLQKDALTNAGCEKIFLDTISGAKAKRPELEKLKEQLREGDTLIVWRLDRLGRSLRDLIDWINWLEGQGVGFVSLQENIDTTSPTGKLTFHIFGAIAEFERNLIQERTHAGLAAARARGRKGGRKPALTPKRKEALNQLYNTKQHTIAELCEMFHISKRTLYSYVNAG
ncbi:MAG: recombinase family protein [Gammaproteobacteria bacterium]|nr:recombinase family protein [Gammaproteobacteria bacterium]